ncbi:MAG: SUMF1/EgtB/PvdO family nonheme iron enzyme, partial [Candidatus Hydrogenedentota bacterium]
EGGAALLAQTTDSGASDEEPAGMDAWRAALERAREDGHEAILPEEDAAGAVDGQLTGRFSFHTSEDETPFWQVDLGAVHELDRVEIHNPHESQRAANFRLLLSDDGGQWREAHQHEGEGAGPSVTVPLADQQARYIRIELPGPNYLHLDEVEVFAADGETNLALNQPATQSSVSQWSSRSIRIESEEVHELGLARRALEPLLHPLDALRPELREELEGLTAAEVPADDPRWADLYSRAVTTKDRLRAAREGLERFSPRAMRMAIDDLASRYPDRFGEAGAALEKVAAIEARLPALREALDAATEGALAEAEAVLEFQRETLLANPLLDFDRILVLERGFGDRETAQSATGGAVGMPANWQTNANTPRRGRWDDRLTVLSNLRDEPRLETLFAPDDGRTLTDPVLDFDAETILFAMEGTNEANWRLFEINADGSDLRQVTPDHGADVAHFDPCYLADGDIVFASTATLMGLPCVFGSNNMASFYKLDREAGAIRQLTFDQDSSWSPTPLANGRVLYQRWEYSDIPHSNSRMLFHMNPDGTDQREYWGGGSYFPPSFFYAKPVPDHPRKVIGVGTGHHGVARSGRLLLVDPAQGRQETEGVVQEIPGHGEEVEPIVRDSTFVQGWPQFLHPYPLSEKYHLAAMKPASDAPWGIYLVDVFDNMVLLKEAEEGALLWPIPMQETPRPPVIPERVDMDDSEARMLVANVYEGEGLDGIPEGTVDALRIFEYYFSYRGVGGLLGSVGMDGPWDIKRVLGTVPVESDGSAPFSVPANTPISIQALDEKGQALQVMRSWTVAQPGENASCIGCHESMSHSPSINIPTPMPAAAQREPSVIQADWEAPVRGLSFERDVQPVLDRHCVGCHDGSPREDGREIPYLKGDRRVTDWSSALSGNAGANIAGGEGFTEAYAQLHRYVRRPGIESDLRMLSPMDFHFSATELGQLLRKGHQGVELDQESWERLVTWFDLNAPFHGTWGEIVDADQEQSMLRYMERANELRERYAPQGPITDYEHIPETPPFDTAFQEPEPPEVQDAPPPDVEGWPFDAEEAQRRQHVAAEAVGLDNGPRKTIDMGEGPVFPAADLGHGDKRESIDVGPVTLDFVLVPGGRFAMGSTEGHPDEAPHAEVEVEPFWMAQFEITNALYRMFDPSHESRDESRHGYQFGRRGFYQDAPDQPAVRVSWSEAMAFCEWLSEKTGLEVTLPTEAQWEWAARAGADTPFRFGGADSDYSAYANLADRTLEEFVQCTASGGYTQAQPVSNPNRFDDWIPRDDTFEDGGLVTEDGGSYRPNPWGLHDMHGNAAEWTRSAYEPYPYREDDGRNNIARSDALPG